MFLEGVIIVVNSVTRVKRVKHVTLKSIIKFIGSKILNVFVFILITRKCSLLAKGITFCFKMDRRDLMS